MTASRAPYLDDPADPRNEITRLHNLVVAERLKHMEIINSPHRKPNRDNRYEAAVRATSYQHPRIDMTLSEPKRRWWQRR